MHYVDEAFNRIPRSGLDRIEASVRYQHQWASGLVCPGSHIQPECEDSIQHPEELVWHALLDCNASRKGKTEDSAYSGTGPLS